MRRRVHTIVAAILVALGGAVPAAADVQPAWTNQQLESFITPGPWCIDIQATDTRPRSNVQLFRCRADSDSLQRYQRLSQIGISGQPSHIFKLKNVTTNKCLTYRPGGASGSPVWAEVCTVNGQGWIVGAGNTFRAVQASNLCLDAVSPSGGNNTGIDIYTCNGQPYTKWRVR